MIDLVSKYQQYQDAAGGGGSRRRRRCRAGTLD